MVCPPHIVKRLQQTLDTFLWNSKTPKIPKHIIELPVPMGGLSYPNVERMFQAIRLSWTRDLFSRDTEGDWKTISRHILSSFADRPGLSENIFKLSLHKHRVSASSLPLFYKKLLKDWIDLDVNESRPKPSTPNLIRNEPLFGNKFITDKAGKPLSRPKTSGKLSLVGQLTYHPAPGIMPPEAIIEEHELSISESKVAQICESLPNDWKRALASDNPTDSQGFVISSKDVDKPLEVSCVATRNFYHLLKPPSVHAARVEQATRKTPFYTSWSISLGEIAWPKVFSSLYKNHRDRKTADIIYTLIHRGTVTRKRMKDMGKQDTSECPRCNTDIETLEHLFFSCPDSTNVWEFALRYLKGLNPTFNTPFKRFVICGWKNSDHPSEDIRLALTATIWRCRNAALFEAEAIDALAYFRKRLTFLLQMRAMSNTQAGKTPCHGFIDIGFYAMGKVFLNL